jgi:hypothetical protein
MVTSSSLSLGYELKFEILSSCVEELAVIVAWSCGALIASFDFRKTNFLAPEN